MTISDDELGLEAEANQNVVGDPDLGEGRRSVYTDLVRFVIGGVVESGSLFLDWLEGEATRQPEETRNVEETDDDNRRRKRAAIGLAFRSAETARKNLEDVLIVSQVVGSVFFSPLIGAMKNLPFPRLSRRFDKLVTRGEAEVEEWVQLGRQEEDRSRQFAKDRVSYIVEDVIDYLSNNPALEELIKTQVDRMAVNLPQTTQIDILVRVLADNYITYLNENPKQVQAMIQTQADTYLDHLSEHPEAVQELIQEHGQGLVDVVRDELRARAVTIDSVLELVVRSIFHRQPRAELPEPSHEVQFRAEFPRQKGDFPRITGGKQEP